MLNHLSNAWSNLCLQNMLSEMWKTFKFYLFIEVPSRPWCVRLRLAPCALCFGSLCASVRLALFKTKFVTSFWGACFSLYCLCKRRISIAARGHAKTYGLHLQLFNCMAFISCCFKCIYGTVQLLHGACIHQLMLKMLAFEDFLNLLWKLRFCGALCLSLWHTQSPTLKFSIYLQWRHTK